MQEGCDLPHTAASAHHPSTAAARPTATARALASAGLHRRRAPLWCIRSSSRSKLSKGACDGGCARRWAGSSRVVNGAPPHAAQQRAAGPVVTCEQAIPCCTARLLHMMQHASPENAQCSALYSRQMACSLWFSSMTGPTTRHCRTNPHRVQRRQCLRRQPHALQRLGPQLAAPQAATAAADQRARELHIW